MTKYLHAIFSEEERDTFVRALKNYAMYEGEATPIEQRVHAIFAVAQPYPSAHDEKIRELEIALEQAQSVERSDLGSKMGEVLSGRWCIDELGWTATAELLMPPVGAVTYFSWWALSLTEAVTGAVDKAVRAYIEAVAKEVEKNV